LKVNVEEDIKDIKPPIKIPPDWKIIALWILGAILLIAIAYYLYKKYKRNKEPKPVVEKEIIIPPHIKALESLKQLEKEELWQKGEIKAYHSRITEIIRNYFEERFHLPALELSTTEIIYHLGNQKGTEFIKDLTEGFLNNADMVKFAKYIPLNSINAEMMKQAIEIVEKTVHNAVIKEAENV
jgi:cell division protein YceG involved in septum cleavage